MTNDNLFTARKIRKVWDEVDHKWYFVIADVVYLFTNSPEPKEYIKKRRKYDKLLSQQWGKIVKRYLFETNGGFQPFNCVDLQGVLLMVQSIPSQRAVPFKIWLAKVMSENNHENKNSELLIQNTKDLYVRKGYNPRAWVEKHVRINDGRFELTEELKALAEEEQTGYATLKEEILNVTNGSAFSEFKNINELQYQNIKDLNTDLDFIFRLLGKASLEEIVANFKTEEKKEKVKAKRHRKRIPGYTYKQLEKMLNKKLFRR